ncbi:MAG: AI-2E family transporter, partial [Candidatus Nanopelagicales bacterium]
MTARNQPQISDGVPDTLKKASGFTWRILVLLAGFGVFIVALNAIFPVVFALFFAMLVAAWTQPVMNLFHRLLPKVLSMLLALLLIGSAILGILFMVIRSSVDEGPKLLESLTSGLNEIEKWLQDGPLNLSDESLSNLLSQAQSWGETAAKGIAVGLLDSLSSIGTLVIAGSVFLFGVIFFLLTPNRIWDWFVSWLP